MTTFANNLTWKRVYDTTTSFKNIVNLLRSILLFLFISSSSGFAAKPSTSADKLIDYLDGKESWYGVYLATKKVGYAYEKWEKEFYEGETVFKAVVGFVLNTDYYKFYFEDQSTFSLKGYQNLITQSV
jgi:hypothetical protein